MIVKVFGALDIFIGIVFILSEILNLVSGSFVAFLGLFLLLKGVFFVISSQDVISGLDIVCAIFILISIIINLPSLIVWLVTIFLIQKGVLSLI